MDANKLKKLKEVGYKMRSTCQMCMHRKFPNRSNWGQCMLHTYDHRKHTDSKRHVSIHVAGGCDDFEADKNEVMLLQASGFDSLADWDKESKPMVTFEKLAQLKKIVNEHHACDSLADWNKGDL